MTDEFDYDKVVDLVRRLPDPANQEPERIGRISMVDSSRPGRLLVELEVTGDPQQLIAELEQGLEVPVYFRPTAGPAEPDRCECCGTDQDVRFRQYVDVELCDRCHAQLLEDVQTVTRTDDGRRVQGMRPEDATWLADILVDLMVGTCWCQVGIGNPMVQTHSQACDRVRAIVSLATMRLENIDPDNSRETGSKNGESV